MYPKICIFKLILLISLLLSACEQESKSKPQEIAKPVKTIIIGQANFTERRSFPGKVEAGQDAELSFQVQGTLNEFPVKKGQAIEKGALIAKIDDTDFKLKVNEANANMMEQKTNFARLEELLEKNFASKAEYDKQKAKYEIAVANLELAKQNLKYTVLTAPFTGRIADTFVDNFQIVKPKEPIVLLQNIDNLDVVIDVPENLVINIKQTEVMESFVIFEGAPNQSYPVTYKKHELNADDATQTYRVYMTLSAPEELSVLPGMTATVHIAVNNKAESLHLLPASAVFSNPDNQQLIWLVDPDTSRLKTKVVEVGALSGEFIQIKSGLAVGDQVVIAGVHALRENQLVKPIKK